MKSHNASELDRKRTGKTFLENEGALGWATENWIKWKPHWAETNKFSAGLCPPKPFL